MTDEYELNQNSHECVITASVNVIVKENDDYVQHVTRTIFSDEIKTITDDFRSELDITYPNAKFRKEIYSLHVVNIHNVEERTTIFASESYEDFVETLNDLYSGKSVQSEIIDAKIVLEKPVLN